MTPLPQAADKRYRAASLMKCYAYLDIETTGLSQQFADLTVIGIAVVKGQVCRMEQFVGQDISAEKLLPLLEGAGEIHTYNGSRFDIPFIKAKLGLDLKNQFNHTDLMYYC